MNKANAVKFSFLVLAVAVKEIIIKSLDFDIQLTYPQLKGAPDVVKLKGVCLLGDFEPFIENIVLVDAGYLSKLNFYEHLKFRLIEIEQNPVELPTGAVKEVIKKEVKK